MPTDIESLIIYAIVLVTLAWLMRNFWQSRKKARSCGHDCCDAVSTPRHPVIQKILDRRDGT